ncbi:MAG: hydrolase of the alpha/beta-hydrolase fold-like protein [Actinotalea sp.]|nr:hydrolase of the alpha/beta-hydrolase fold-like protein [Actinotalea sp.]
MTTPDPATPDLGTPEPATVVTAHGPAAVHHRPVEGARGLLVLGHGAGGGIGAPDLTAALAAAHEARFSVVLVEQPYRVAGRRAPPRSPVLDAAWLTVVEHVRREAGADQPIVTGGRSSGARVACRTAEATGADGVLCLAFPLRPPRRQARAGAADRAEAPSRLPELEAVPVPVLVVQGARDPFGVPPAGPDRDVVVVTGDHALRSDVGTLRAAVSSWLTGVVRHRT